MSGRDPSSSLQHLQGRATSRWVGVIGTICVAVSAITWAEDALLLLYCCYWYYIASQPVWFWFWFSCDSGSDSEVFHSLASILAAEGSTIVTLLFTSSSPSSSSSLYWGLAGKGSSYSAHPSAPRQHDTTWHGMTWWEGMRNTLDKFRRYCNMW